MSHFCVHVLILIGVCTGTPTSGNYTISYLPILVPIWAWLPSDQEHYPRPLPYSPENPVIPLTDTSACLCLTRFSASRHCLTKPCIVYGLTGARPGEIQVQACPQCPVMRRRYIGPDCRELGLFNYNNNILFTHDLLDDYTNSFTSSETPFTAWVSVVSRRYASHRSLHPFVSEATFRSAWFAYTRLQSFDNDMTCPRCGPTPDDVIWDGVTLAFAQKHVTESLQPPTVCHQLSACRASRYRSNQQLIVAPALRKSLKKVVTGRSLVLSARELRANPVVEEEEVTDENEGQDLVRSTAEQQDSLDVLERIRLIPQVAAELSAINVHAGNLFQAHFGIDAILSKRTVSPVYQRLFIQVRQIFLFFTVFLMTFLACRIRVSPSNGHSSCPSGPPNLQCRSDSP